MDGPNHQRHAQVQRSSARHNVINWNEHQLGDNPYDAELFSVIELRVGGDVVGGDFTPMRDEIGEDVGGDIGCCVEVCVGDCVGCGVADTVVCDVFREAVSGVVSGVADPSYF